MKFLVALAETSPQLIAITAQHAEALDAEVILLRVIADPQHVGVVAELIATDEPERTARAELQEAENELQAVGVRVSSLIRTGDVASTIVETVIEEGADLLLVATRDVRKPSGISGNDPVVHYLVDHCPTALCLVREQTT